MDQRHVAHEAGRRQMIEFIRRSPSVVDIYRTEKVDDGAGGFTRGEPTLVHGFVACRFVPQESTGEQLDYIVDATGRRVTVAYSVIFLPEIQVRRGDSIVRKDDGSDWFAGKVFTIPSWRRVVHVGENIG